MKFILDAEGEPKPATVDEWAREFDGDRRVKAETFDGEEFWLSTVFVGITEDHIWETMLFRLGDGGRQESPYELDSAVCGGSRADALQMHENMKAKHNL